MPHEARQERPRRRGGRRRAYLNHPSCLQAAQALALALALALYMIVALLVSFSPMGAVDR